MKTNPYKIALVHDWMTNFAGAERVLLAFHEIWPNAPIFTSTYNREKMKQFSNADVRVSFLQKWPLASKKHQLYLPLLPIAFESFDFKDFDIVVSSSHSCAKGIVVKPNTLHISFCHTPMRYAWDDSQNYVKESRFAWPIKKLIPSMMNYIRMWDRVSADRVDHFIANSNFVKQRIKKYYKADAEVIHPPVNASFYTPAQTISDYFLFVGRLISYKRVDHALAAFNELKLPLKIIGTGPEYAKLKSMAKSNIEFLGSVSDSDVKQYLAHAKAFIFPAIEDFGIAPLEAMASGRPVIAFKGGGALDYVIEGITGTFYNKQHPLALADAVKRFDYTKYNPKVIRQHALKFDAPIFKKKIKEFVEGKFMEFKNSNN